jgi:hypothetical protein
MQHAWERLKNIYIHFWPQNLKRKVHLEDVGVDGKLKEIGWEGVDWLYLAEDRD